MVVLLCWCTILRRRLVCMETFSAHSQPSIREMSSRLSPTQAATLSLHLRFGSTRRNTWTSAQGLPSTPVLHPSHKQAHTWHLEMSRPQLLSRHYSTRSSSRRRTSPTLLTTRMKDCLGWTRLGKSEERPAADQQLLDPAPLLAAISRIGMVHGAFESNEGPTTPHVRRRR